jgi:diphthamide synthase (EF-2-diphthine--ammonia ligase)
MDVCGENGEYHTFAFDGPVFKQAVHFTVGEKVFKEFKQPKGSDDSCGSTVTSDQKKAGFWYTDLIPV